MITTSNVHQSFQETFPTINFSEQDFGVCTYVQAEHFSLETVIALVNPNHERGFARLEYWIWFCDADRNRFCLSAMEEISVVMAMYELRDQLDFGVLYPRLNDDGSRNVAVYKTVEISEVDLVTSETDPPSSRVARYASLLFQEAQSVSDVIGGLASSQIKSHTDIKMFLQMSETVNVVAS